MAFGPEGLTLGAGTVLAATDDDERNIALDEAAEARLQALLAAAYVRPVSAQTLRYIRRGAASWRDGDKAMAAMHLAMTGLTPLREPKAAARRLFMADQLMKAGATPEVIFRALDLEPPLAKVALSIGGYNPLEPRNLRGEWALAGEVAEGAAAALTQAGKLIEFGGVLMEAGALALAVATAAAPTIIFGVAMIPFDQRSPKESYGVPGHPDMHLERASGDRLWRLIYKDKSGAQRTSLEQPDGTLKDYRGKTVGYIVKSQGHAGDKGAAISLPAVDAKVDEDEPQLCAAAGPDKFGGGPGSAGRLFEDMVKPVINPPPHTTPSGFGVALLNPNTGNMVNFDDCQRSTGFMYEYKGPTYTPFLQRANKNKFLGPSATKKMIKQATNQLQAAEGKHIVWLFADRDAAKDVRKKFDENENKDLKTIEIRIFPSMETIK
jgi:hypothetical protein